MPDNESFATHSCSPLPLSFLFPPNPSLSEHLGIHPWDARWPLSHYRAAFPAVDFSLIEHEHDALWEPDRRELDEEVR